MQMYIIKILLIVIKMQRLYRCRMYTCFCKLHYQIYVKGIRTIIFYTVQYLKTSGQTLIERHPL